MKTPDEIKKMLKKCRNADCGLCRSSDYCDIKAEALEYIQQLEYHIGELTEKVAQLEAAQPKWNSVKEKLPEDDYNYLVFTSDRNEEEIATYYGDGEWLTHDLINLTPLVTHWMPLPEPPKEDA